MTELIDYKPIEADKRIIEISRKFGWYLGIERDNWLVKNVIRKWRE